MKKLLIVAVLAFAFAVAGFSQRTHVPQGSYVMVDENVLIDDSTDTYTCTFDLRKLDRMVYFSGFVAFNSSVKSASTTSPRLRVYSQYSYDGETFLDLDTAYFAGTVSDSMTIIESVSSARPYPYIRLSVAGVDSVSTRVDKAGLKYAY